MKNKEIWKPINGFEGFYEISNHGKCRSVDRWIKKSNNASVFFKGKILKPGMRSGYKRFFLKKEGKVTGEFLHRLVAKAFIDNPFLKPQVNHKDGNKLNNEIENLEWNTEKENSHHAWRTGLNKKIYGSSQWLNIQVDQYDINGIFIMRHKSIKYAAISIGVNPSSISRAIKFNRVCKKHHIFKVSNQ